MILPTSFSLIRKMGTSIPPTTPERRPKDEEDRVKLLDYIFPLFADFVKKNSINPAIGYEVSCEIEMNMIELCQSKGIDSSELEIHRHIAEMNWKARKESIVNKGD